MVRPRLDESVRNELLDAVDRLLGRYGYGKMSIADVAREAGIGKGTVYLFFPSKEELVLSAIDRIAERLLAEARAIADGPGPVIARLRRCLLMRVLARFDGAQTQLLIFSFELFDATLLLVAGRWQRLVFRNRPPAQPSISLQVSALPFPSPIGQMGGI